jgi:hypothetical protein
MDRTEMPHSPDEDFPSGTETGEAGAGAGERLDNPAARSIDALHGSASMVLQRIADLADETEISFGAIIDALEERAFGMLLFLFAIPALIPFLVGINSFVSIPIALLALQMIAGQRRPWLPRRIRAQTISMSTFRKMTKTVVPWLKRIESVTRPRLKFFAGRWAEPVLAVFILIFAGVVAIPGFGTNGVPGFAVMLIGIAMIERDGVLAIFGAVMGAVYTVLFFTIGYKAIEFAISQAMRVFSGN